MQFLWDTLDVVQSVDTDDDFLTLERLLQLAYSVLDLLFQEAVLEGGDVDTDREGTDVDEPALVLDTVGQSVDVQDSLDGGQEVARVVVSVEAEEVAAQHTSQDLLSDRQDSVDLGGRERRVQEPAQLDVPQLTLGDLLLQHLGQQHQVVVVDPYQVVVLHGLEDDLGEGPVGLVVSQPGVLIEIDLTRVVVEQRPQDRVTEPVVVQVCDLVAQKHRHSVELLEQVLLDLLFLIVRDLQTGPPIPLERSGLLQTL